MKIALTPREHHAMAAVIVGNIAPEDRTERLVFRQLLVELRMRAFADQIAVGSVAFSSSSPDVPEDYEVSDLSLAYLIGKLDKLRVTGPYAAIVADVEDRVVAGRAPR